MKNKIGLNLSENTVTVTEIENEKKKLLRLSKCGHCFNCLFEIAIWKLEGFVVLWNIIQVPTVSEMVSHYTWERRMEKCFEEKGQKNVTNRFLTITMVINER